MAEKTRLDTTHRQKMPQSGDRPTVKLCPRTEKMQQTHHFTIERYRRLLRDGPTDEAVRCVLRELLDEEAAKA
jgi:hypothetical protein